MKSFNRKCSLFLLFTALALAGFAQERTITGKVTDVEDGLGIPGVNIVERGTSNGTVTDVEGNFRLIVGEGATLVFSFIGYVAQEIEVGNSTQIDVMMIPDVLELQEVVMIGYGVQEKKVSTGSIGKVSAEKLTGFNVASVTSALDGYVPGLIVSETSGQPGSGKTMLIRGINTNGNNSPLFVVDGMQVDNIDNINPSDIESVDILKDAASSAIYGARAANGVVIVTTKKGSEEGAQFTYEGFTSISRPWKLPEMLNSEQYVELTREKFSNANQTGALDLLGFPQVGDPLPVSTDWMDVIFDDAALNTHKVSISFPNVFFSGEYWNQTGVIGGDKSNYKRYSFRLNTNKEIKPWLSFGENLYINRVENMGIGVNNAFGTVIADAFAYDPLTDVYDPTAQYGFAQSQWVQKEYINPLSRLFITDQTGHSDQILGNLFVDVEPVKGLRYHSDLGIDYQWNNWQSFTPDYAFHSAFVNVFNDVNQGYEFREALQLENYLNYEKRLGQHDFDVLIGTSFRKTKYETAGGSGSGIPDAVKFNQNWQWLNSAVDSLPQLSYGTKGVDYRLISYYGRLIYGFKDRYLLTATVRRDGSSNFGRNNRWGVFPSVSLGWIVSDEPFFPTTFINFLKIRGSWGINGNDRIAPLSYAARVENVFTYSFGQNQQLYTGAALATPPNPNIKWEESEQWDIGIEVGLFDDHVTGEFDVYRKTTKDLLMAQVIPGYLGATNNPVTNLGEIRNTGFESSLFYRGNAGPVKVNIGLQYTTFKNEVLDVAGEAGFINGWSWPVRNTPITRMSEGYPIAHFVGYEALGIFQSQGEVFSHINKSGDVLQPNARPGDIKYADINDDGVINSDDITNIGDPWPDHVFGITLSASFKGFDLSMVFASQIGHQIYRTYERSDITYTNYQTFWLDRWTESNPSTEYPRLVSNDPNNNQRPSSFYVEDGSFLRMRNLQIGYNIPPTLLSKILIKEARIYFSANNLFTITGYKGFDPEIGSGGWILDSGIDKGYYPTNKSFGGGIRITL